jgi:hypothetical protein
MLLPPPDDDAGPAATLVERFQRTGEAEQRTTLLGDEELENECGEAGV